MTWKRDERLENVRTFGDFKIFSEVNSDRETAHVIHFPDGREIRVLPDDAHNGRVRAVIVRGAVETIRPLYGRLGDAELRLVLIGALTEAGVKWQELAGEVSIEEWLAEWLEAGGSAENLLEELDADGWKIIREGS
jgi:hypothetical protein